MADLAAAGPGLRLASLWAAWLFVMLFHVELGLMPLFHGLSVEIRSRLALSQLPRMFLAMLLYFLLPVLAMLLAVHAVTAPAGWSASAPMRAAQFGFSLLYSATNLLHLVADLRIPDSRSDQVLLMLLLSALGVWINVEAWHWWLA